MQVAVPYDVIVLAGRQDEGGDGFGGEVHRDSPDSGEALGKQRAGICWPSLTLLETGNGAQSSVKQGARRFPADLTVS